MGSVSTLYKKVYNGGWSGWVQLGGATVDYVNSSGRFVVYGIGLSMSSGEYLTSLSVSTNFVAPLTSSNPSTATCYLYASDPTGYSSPPSGAIATNSVSFTASNVGSYLTFNFGGIYVPATTMVYAWFTCSTQYSSYGDNQIYHYGTGNGYTYNPTAYANFGGANSGSNTGGSSSGGGYTITVRSGVEGVIDMYIKDGYPSTYKIVDPVLTYGYAVVGWYEYDASAPGGYGAFIDTGSSLIIQLTRNYTVIPRTRKFEESELRKITVVPHSFLDMSMLKFYYRGTYEYTEYDKPYPALADWTVLEAPYEFYVYDLTHVLIYFESKNGEEIRCVYSLSDGVLERHDNAIDDSYYAPGDTYRDYYKFSFGTNLISDNSKEIVIAPNIYNQRYGTHSITVQAGTGITSASGSGMYGSTNLEYGEVAIAKATPASGYGFKGWYVNNELVSTSNPYFVEVFDNVTLVAQGALYRTISTGADAGISSLSGAGQYIDGSSCTLLAELKYGYSFTGWQKGGTVVSSANPYTFTVSSNTAGNYTATTSPREFTVDLETSEGVGTLSIVGGYTHEYLSSCTVDVFSIPEGYEFKGWSVNGTVVSTDERYTFTVTGDITLVGIITLKMYEITTEAGRGIESVLGGGTYAYGSYCTITAKAKEGYVFHEWISTKPISEGSSFVIVGYESNQNPYTFKVTSNGKYRAVGAGWAESSVSAYQEYDGTFHNFQAWVYTGDGGGPNKNGWHRATPRIYTTP